MKYLAVFLAALTIGCVSTQDTSTSSGSRSSSGSSNSKAFAALSKSRKPSRPSVRAPYRYTMSPRGTGTEGVTYFTSGGGGSEEVVGFSLENDGSPRINPASGKNSSRIYAFNFPDRARQEIHLLVTDDTGISGNYSHDVAFREWHFFPRLYLPSLQRIEGGSKLKVTLPTGEAVIYDARTKEIVSGALSEQPIDFHPNRQTRDYPRVRYSGRYLALTSVQRAESPRRDRLWGKQTVVKIYYPAKYPQPCTIAAGQIWDQAPEPGSRDPKLHMLHTDDSSLFQLVESHCNWNLSDLRQIAGSGPSSSQGSHSASSSSKKGGGAVSSLLSRLPWSKK